MILEFVQDSSHTFSPLRGQTDQIRQGRRMIGAALYFVLYT